MLHNTTFAEHLMLGCVHNMTSVDQVDRVLDDLDHKLGVAGGRWDVSLLTAAAALGRLFGMDGVGSGFEHIGSSIVEVVQVGGLL